MPEVELPWFMCGEPGCPMGYPTLSALAAHRKGHRPKEVCPICGAERRRIQAHMDRYHPAEPEVGEEFSFETAEHWQRLEELEAENRQLKADLAAAQAEITRVDGLRQRYWDKLQKNKKQ